MHPVWILSRKTSLIFLLSFLACTCRADTLPIALSAIPENGIPLQPHFAVWEDATRMAGLATARAHMQEFVPMNGLPPGRATDAYWLRVTLDCNKYDGKPMGVAFSNLTYVDLYLFHEGRCIRHSAAGIFRPRSALSAGDSRCWLSLPPLEKGPYTLLLRVQHTKHFQPVFNFVLEERDSWLRQRHDKESIDLRSQGALLIFLFYILVSWIVTRFRPYAWLLLLITGVAFYNLCTDGYFIEWFFPEHPATGWLFNTHFVDLGVFGLLMLVIDFWEVRKYNPRLYRTGAFIFVFLAGLVLTRFCINLFTGNFWLSNLLNVWAPIVYFPFLAILVRNCWARLNGPQRYLAYGLFIFMAMGVLASLGSAIFNERWLTVTPHITTTVILSVFILFSTGLKLELNQHEIDKQIALQELNRLQQHQNVLLEKRVEQRTIELKESNLNLQEQKQLLADKNARIETLINELNHRVKNNLQLLYSLISLQLPSIRDEAAREILKDNIARIRAMILVSRKFYHFDDGDSILLDEFMEELCDYLHLIYDPQQQVKILRQIPTGIRLDSRQTLSFGLVLSELLTNSFKYAFTGISDPVVMISIQLDESGNMACRYSDNGVGLKGEPDGRSSLGMSLVQDLIRQMNGWLTTQSGAGLAYEFILPIPSNHPINIL
jgi:two-component sensor histidine kinase